MSQNAARVLRVAIAVALGAVLAWQTAASAVVIARRAWRDGGTPGMFDTEEERLRRAFGRDANSGVDYWEAFCTLREVVPDDGVVYCNLVHPAGHPAALRDAFLLQRLRHALHPRFVHGLDIDAARDRATLVSDPRLFVCDFEPDFGEAMPPYLQSLKRTPQFELWGVPR